jgi:hypothetical protein
VGTSASQNQIIKSKGINPMSTLETILSRMMSEPAFAEAVFADSEKALVDYKLSAGEIIKFKGTSRTDFETLTSQAPEERKSLAKGFDSQGRLLIGTESGIW